TKLEPIGGMHPGGKHIVAVAAPGHGLAADGPAMLLERHDICKHLTWVRAPGESVDHRHGRVARKLDQSAMVEGSDHDRIDVAREHARGVGNRLAAPELHLLTREHDGAPTKLAHGDIEGDPRASRRLIED